jgi:hypothetical protein
MYLKGDGKYSNDYFSKCFLLENILNNYFNILKKLFLTLAR